MLVAFITRTAVFKEVPSPPLNEIKDFSSAAVFGKYADANRIVHWTVFNKMCAALLCFIPNDSNLCDSDRSTRTRQHRSSPHPRNMIRILGSDESVTCAAKCFGNTDTEHCSRAYNTFPQLSSVNGTLACHSQSVSPAHHDAAWILI